MNDELISFSVRIPKNLHFDLKHRALLSDMSMQELTTEAFCNYLDALDSMDADTPDPGDLSLLPLEHES